MNDYVIMTDSCCDLPDRLAKELGLSILPLTVMLDGKLYRNYLDEREISSQAFYSQLRAGKSASTSAVNVEEFSREMEWILHEGKDILYLGFSSGLSATYQTAVIAAEELREKYPGQQVLTVDTLAASMGQGLLVYLAAQEKARGRSIEQVRDFVEQNRLRLVHDFTVDDLNHLKRGGRISTAAAILGSTLNIKPILHVDDEGHLVPKSKVRGRKQAIQKLIDQLAESDVAPAEQSIFISHGDCLEEAEQLAAQIRARFAVKEIVISYVGPVIGAHSGPGTLALFYLAQKR